MPGVGTSSTFRRLVVILTLTVMAPVGHAVVACSGWSGSATQRMACCGSAGDGCAAVRADDCCAHGETRQNIETTSVIAISPGDSLSERVVPAIPPVRSLRQALRPLAERPDTYLLDSAFLI